MAFNIVAQIQLQAPGNTSQVANQIQSQLQNINAKINIQIPTGVQNTIGQIATGINALNNNLNTLNKTLGASTTSLNSLQNILTSTNSALSNTATSATKTSSSITAASNAMEEFGRVAGVAGRRFLGFTLISNSVISAFNAISTSVKSALDFEREFIKLSQVGEAYRSDLVALRSEIDRLSRSFGASSQELLESSVTLRQAGYSVKEVTQALEALSKASLSPSFGNFKELSEGLIAIRSQFRLASTDIEGAFSSINAVSNAYAVESKDVLDAVRRTGGAFRAVGGDLNQFIALFTSVRATTRESAESIATGLRTIFTRLQRPELTDNLKAMGINLRYTREEAQALGNTNLEQQFVGAYEAVRRLSSALKDLPTTDARYSKIVEELGGYRQISKVIPLLQEFTTAQNALNVAQSSGASLTVSADQAQQNFLVNIQKIKEQFLALTRNLVNSQGFQVFLDSLIKIGNVAVSIFDKISPLIPLFTTLAAIKFATNIGSFFTGVVQGFQGIGPKRYATGGPVGGIGVSDTQPALLTPGEHVLTRRQVYNMGGHAQVQKFAEGGFTAGNRSLSRSDLDLLFKIGVNQDTALARRGTQERLISLLGPSVKTGGDYTSGQQVFDALGLKGFGAFSGNPDKNSLDRRARGGIRSAIEFAEARRQAISSGQPIQAGKLILPFAGDDLGIISSGQNDRGALSAGLNVTNISQKGLGELPKDIQALLAKAGVTNIVGGVRNYVASTALSGQLNSLVGTSLGAIGAAPSDLGAALNDIKGHFFEKILLQKGYGLPSRPEQASLDVVGDIPDAIKEQLYPRFRSNYADLKYRASGDNNVDALRKYLTHLAQQDQLHKRLGFSVGGVVPGTGNSDTVPVDLPAGSFVIRKSSAQAIGYDNLSRMGYANGGLVTTGKHIGQIAAFSSGAIRSPNPVRGDNFNEVVNFIGNRLPDNKKSASRLVASNFTFSAPYDTYLLNNEKIKSAFEPDAINTLIQKAENVIATATGNKVNLKKTALQDSISGLLLEGFISSITKKQFEGGQEPLDFIFNGTQAARLSPYVAPSPVNVEGADAKRTTVAASQILGKAVRSAFGPGNFKAWTTSPLFSAKNLSELAADEIKSGRVKQFETLQAEIKTNRGEQQSILGKKFAKGGSVEDDYDFQLPLTSKEKDAKARVSKFINKFYGKTGVDLTKGLNEIKLYDSNAMSEIYGFRGKGIKGFYDYNTARMGLNADSPDLEGTILHEGIHGLDYLLGRQSGKKNMLGSELPGSQLNQIADMVRRFIAPDLKEKTKFTKDYIGSRHEAIAFTGQQAIDSGFNDNDAFNDNVPVEKRALLRKGLTKSLLSVLSGVKGKMSDSPLELPLTIKDEMKGSLGSRLFKFADGGSPQDTVPAVLTPGEFVFNREAAQKIGYQNLHHMNRTGEIHGFHLGGRVPQANGTNLADYPAGLQAVSYAAKFGPPSPINNTNTSFQNQLLSILGTINTTLLSGISTTNKNTNTLNNTTTASTSRFDKLSGAITLLGGLIVTAAGYLSNHLEKSAGTAESAINGGEDRFRSRRVQSGAIQGGVVGAGLAAATIPTILGIIGAPFTGGLSLAASTAISAGLGATAIGAGAAYGGSSSANAADSDIAAARLERAQRNLSDITTAAVQRGGGSLYQTEQDSLARNIEDAFNAIRQKSITDNTNFFGTVDVRGQRTQEENQRRAFVQSQLPEFNKILLDFTNIAARDAARAGGTPAELRDRLSTNGSFGASLQQGANRQIIELLAQAPGQSVSSVTNRTIQEAVRVALAENARISNVQALVSQDRGLSQFERLADTISRVNVEMEKFTSGLESIDAIFDNKISPNKFSFGARGNVLFGTGDAEDNAESIRGISRGLGSAGPGFAEYLTGYDQIRRVASTEIATRFNRNSQDLDVNSFAEQIRNAIESSLGGRQNINQSQTSIIDSYFANLQRLTQDQLKQKIESGDISTLNDELFKNVSRVAEQYTKIKEEFEKFINKLSGLVSEYERRQLAIGESTDRINVSRQDSAALALRLPFLRQGIEPTGLQGRLTTEQINQTNLARLQRLSTSFGNPIADAENPQAIARRQIRLNEEIERTRIQSDQLLSDNPLSVEGLRLAQSLITLRRQSTEAGLALRDLTDGANRNRAAQEELTILNRGQQDRTRFAENLLTGGIQGRVQFASGLRSYNNALSSGQDISNLPSVIVSDIFRSLRQIGDIPVSAFGANERFYQQNAQRFGIGIEESRGLTGNQVAERLVQSDPRLSAFTNPVELDVRRNELLTSIERNTARQVAANEGVAQVQQAAQNNSNQLREQFVESFRNTTAVRLLQADVDRATVGVNVAQGNANAAAQAVNTAIALNQFGVTDQRQVDFLNGGGSGSIERYRTATALANTQRQEISNRFGSDFNPDFLQSILRNGPGQSVNIGDEFIENLTRNLSSFNLSPSAISGATTAITQLRGRSPITGERTEPNSAFGLGTRAEVVEIINGIVSRTLRTGQTTGQESQTVALREISTGLGGQNRVSDESVRQLLRYLENEQNRNDIRNLNQNNPIEQVIPRVTSATDALNAASQQLIASTDALREATDRLGASPNPARQFASVPLIGGILNAAVGRASGGPIPGIGNSDTVPAMLTPGEFVLNAEASRRIGLRNLHQLNNIQHFADGGRVRPRTASGLQEFGFEDEGEQLDLPELIRNAFGAIPPPFAAAIPEPIQRPAGIQINRSEILDLAAGNLGRPVAVQQPQLRLPQGGISPAPELQLPARNPPVISDGTRRGFIRSAIDNDGMSVEDAYEAANLIFGLTNQNIELNRQAARVAAINPSVGNVNFGSTLNFGRNDVGRAIPPQIQPQPVPAPIITDVIRRNEELINRPQVLPRITPTALTTLLNGATLGRRTNSQDYGRNFNRDSIESILSSGTAIRVDGFGNYSISETGLISILRSLGDDGYSPNPQLLQQIRSLSIRPDNLRGRNTFTGLGSGQQAVYTQLLDVLSRNSNNLLPGYATGGFVNGTGTTDNVPAMLTPGEFVLNRSAVSNIGVNNLQNLNKAQGFAQGGIVGSGVVNSGDFTSVVSAMNNFISGLNPFIDAMKAFPHELTANFNHTVNINLNGAEVMASLQPQIQELVIRTASEQLTRYISDNMPEAGRPQ